MREPRVLLRCLCLVTVACVAGASAAQDRVAEGARRNTVEVTAKDTVDASTQDDLSWIDPNDPTKGSEFEGWSDPHNPSDRNYESQTVRVTYGRQVDTSIRLILGELFHALHVDVAEGAAFTRTARLHLPEDDVETVREFMQATDVASFEQHERLRHALAHLVQYVEETVVPSRFETFVLSLEPYVKLLNVLLLVPAFTLLTAFLWLSIARYRTRSLIMLGVLAIFVFTMWTTYDRRYQEEVARRLEAASLFSDSCRPPTFFESTLQAVSGLLLLPKKSACRRFIEGQTVSITSTISLFDIFMEVLSSLFFAPVEYLGIRLNRFIIHLYTDLPLPLAIAVTVIMGISSLILALIIFGYRIRAPFFALEPHSNVPLASIIRAAGDTVAAVAAGDDDGGRGDKRALQSNTQQQQLQWQRTSQGNHEITPRGVRLRIKERREEGDSDEEDDEKVRTARERSRERGGAFVTPRSPQRVARLEERLQREGEERRWRQEQKRRAERGDEEREKRHLSLPSHRPHLE